MFSSFFSSFLPHNKREIIWMLSVFLFFFVCTAGHFLNTWGIWGFNHTYSFYPCFHSLIYVFSHSFKQILSCIMPACLWSREHMAWRGVWEDLKHFGTWEIVATRHTVLMKYSCLSWDFEGNSLMLCAAKVLFIAEMSLCIYQCICFSFPHRLIGRILHHFVILWRVTWRRLTLKLVCLDLLFYQA